jgi:hypothetical protein
VRFNLPHCAKSLSISGSLSHRIHNCWTHTWLATYGGSIWKWCGLEIVKYIKHIAIGRVSADKFAI